jgi:hypothetical protein
MTGLSGYSEIARPGYFADSGESVRFYTDRAKRDLGGVVTRQELKDELLMLGRTLDHMAVRRPGASSDLSTDAFMAMVDREGELLHMLYEASPAA